MTKPFALIVEDDPKLGTIYQTALQQAGYDTYLDSDGDQVMEVLPRIVPALIVLDMHLPYASGTDILRQLRADERWAKIPVIVTTADLLIARSLEGKAEYVLVKPVSVGRLLEIANQLMSAAAEKSSGHSNE